MKKFKTVEFMSAEQYLASERTSRVRREFVNGLVYAMSGANQKHNVIAEEIAEEYSTCSDEEEALLDY